jgi:hypothetical protein
MADTSIIPNIDQVLTNRASGTVDTTTLTDDLVEFRVLSAMCCSEATFLASAFGPDFLDGKVTMEQFLEAFRVDAPPSGQLA